jgi:hypothetical protein
LFLTTVKKNSIRNVLLVIGASVVVSLAFYGLSSWLLQLYVSGINLRYGPSVASPYPASEVAGGDAILLILGGILFLLGSGGISRNSANAAIRAAIASAMGKETVGPGEIMRRDAWRPKGNKLLGLISIVAGAFSILLAFVLA